MGNPYQCKFFEEGNVKQKKKNPNETEKCPVPPWEPKRIVGLAKFLALSQARLAKFIGISYSAIRAWHAGRSKTISSTILTRLKKFEKQIPSLRKAALEKLAFKAQKESRKDLLLQKPWPIARIRSFMHTWGMSQAEFAIFCDVSYDSVTSWSRGRRKLVRRKTAEHITLAEEAAKKRGFPKIGPNTKVNPWEGLRDFFKKNLGKTKIGEIPSKLLGTYKINAVETDPKKFRAGKISEKIVIKPLKGNKTFKVQIFLSDKKFDLVGKKVVMGGVDLVLLEACDEDPNFFGGKAGCLNFGKQCLRVSFWPTKKLPIRFVGTFAKK